MYESSGYRPESNFAFNCISLLLCLLFIVGIIGFSIWESSLPTTEVTITVTSTDRVGNRWMVLGVDKQGNPVSLKNKDSFFRHKTNSSDLQAGIQVGKTYTFRVAGIRNTLFSMYPNILSVVSASDTSE